MSTSLAFDDRYLQIAKKQLKGLDWSRIEEDMPIRIDVLKTSVKQPFLLIIM
jgi:hypothetical protein